MSDATERPGDHRADPDPDAWAWACAEDLAEERERRRSARGDQWPSAVEELRGLVSAVADRVADLSRTPGGAVAYDAVRQVASRAKAAAEPVVERHPEVFDHLAAAGSELLAAYRAAVADHERLWTAGAAAKTPSRPATEGSRASTDADESSGRASGDSEGRGGDRPTGHTGGHDDEGDAGRGVGAAGSEHIDLD